MAEKDWSKIGPVTLEKYDGKRWEYPSLAAAIRDNDYHWHCWGSTLKPYCGTDDWFWRSYAKGADYVVRDELGMIIPVWRITEEATKLGHSPVWREIRWYRDKGYDHDRDYRKAPVPGVWSRRGGRHCDRPVRTAQEIRENDALRFDEDAREHGITARSSRTYLPHAHEDPRFARRGDNWKHYRKTRWKPSRV